MHGLKGKGQRSEAASTDYHFKGEEQWGVTTEDVELQKWNFVMKKNEDHCKVL